MIDRESPIVQARLGIHEAIASAVANDPPYHLDEDEGLTLRGWVAVADVVCGRGGRSIYVFSADALGEQDLTPWERGGLLHYALREWEPIVPDPDSE